MAEQETNPFAQFAIQVDKKSTSPPPPPKPSQKYQSLTFLSLVIQGVYALLVVLLLFGVSAFFSLRSNVGEAQKLQALLKAPPPGTDRGQLLSAQDRLKSLVEVLRKDSDMLVMCGAAMILFPGVLGLAFSGWTYKATQNLTLLGVPKLVYSPFIAGVGMFLVPLLVAAPILNQVAKGSDPQRLTPYGHRETGVSLLVVAWWLATVLSAGVGIYLFLQTPTQEQLAAGKQLSGVLLIASATISAISYLLGILLVGSVWQNQAARLELVQNPPARPVVVTTPEFEDQRG